MIEDLDRDCRRIHARILPHLPALQAEVEAVRRDISARPHGRRLSMAKATAPAATDGADTANGLKAEPTPHSASR
jgi:hypothetical protein